MISSLSRYKKDRFGITRVVKGSVLNPTRSIKIEYNASRDKWPRNVFVPWDFLLVECSVRGLQLNSFTTIDHDMLQCPSLSSTCAINLILQPSPMSKFKVKKSLLAISPNTRASVWSHCITWQAICFHKHPNIPQNSTELIFTVNNTNNLDCKSLNIP